MSANPGPWHVEKCSGHNGWRAGFYVARSRPDWNEGATEWMKDAKRRIAYFRTESSAHAAIAKATQP